MIIFSRILNRFMARKTKVSLSLTPEAVTVLDDLATQLSVSRSGLVEQLAQGHLAVKAPAAQQGAALMLGSKGISVTPFDPSLDLPTGEPPKEPSTGADAPAVEPPAADTPAVPISEGHSKGSPEGNTPEEDASGIGGGAIASPPPAEPEMAGGADAPAADQPGEPTAAAAGMAPVPPPEPPHPQADPVPALQSQLLAAIAAQDTLKAQAQAQAQELIQLRQELAQQRSLALLGERQINRWRYYTYSR